MHLREVITRTMHTVAHKGGGKGTAKAMSRIVRKGCGDRFFDVIMRAVNTALQSVRDRGTHRQGYNQFLAVPYSND